MAFNEDLSLFIDTAEFAVPVVAGGISGSGIFDSPGEFVGDDGMAISAEYQVKCLSSEFGSLIYDDPITVNGESYVVRRNKPIHDGAFCLIWLTKLDVTDEALGTNAGAFLVTLDGRYLRVSTTATAGEAIGTNTGAFVVTLDGRYLRVSQ